MIFSNPQILRTNNDIKIGGAKVSGNAVSYDQYTLHLEIHVTQLVEDFIADDVKDGATRAQAIDDCLNLVYTTLTYVGDEKLYPNDVPGIVNEIMRSEEYQNWITDIHYRFLAVHKGVVTDSTPIEAVGHLNPSIEPEIAEEVENNDTLELFMSGLRGENYLD